jgi:hypothetical protein
MKQKTKLYKILVQLGYAFLHSQYALKHGFAPGLCERYARNDRKESLLPQILVGIKVA